MKNIEQNIQTAVVKYLRFAHKDCLFTNTLGGVRLVTWKQRNLLKSTGYRKGVSDLLILEPNKKYYGLFLEIKKPKGIISKEQKEFLIEANKRNYYAVVCFGFDECLQTIEQYFKNKL